jgi:hypothetical protein
MKGGHGTCKVGIRNGIWAGTRQEGWALSMGIGLGHGAWQLGTGHGRWAPGMPGRWAEKGWAGIEVGNEH